jgi:hypothetical protein
MVGYIIFSSDKNINSYKLYRISNILCKKLLFNKIHNKFKQELNREEIIKNYNIKDEEIENNKDITIIPMLELNEEQLKSYLLLFENESEQLDKYSEMLSMVIYNQLSSEKLTIKRELNIILEKISNFWEDTYNLTYDDNKRFLSRKFKCIQGENQADVDYLREINYFKSFFEISLFLRVKYNVRAQKKHD